MAEVFRKIALRWMPLDHTDDKSTLVQIMAWCRQATSHYLSQCWHRFMSPYSVTRPQCVKIHQIWRLCLPTELFSMSDIVSPAKSNYSCSRSTCPEIELCHKKIDIYFPYPMTVGWLAKIFKVSLCKKVWEFCHAHALCTMVYSQIHSWLFAYSA